MELDDEAEEAQSRKRRRRSVRNLRRRSIVVPFNVNEPEEMEERIDSVSTSKEDDMYGSLWLETDEPVRKKKKRRSSMFIGMMAGQPLPQISYDDLVCETGDSVGTAQDPGLVGVFGNTTHTQYKPNKEPCSLICEANTRFKLGNTEQINTDEYSCKHSTGVISHIHETTCLTKCTAEEKFKISSSNVLTSNGETTSVDEENVLNEQLVTHDEVNTDLTHHAQVTHEDKNTHGATNQNESSLNENNSKSSNVEYCSPHHHNTENWIENSQKCHRKLISAEPEKLEKLDISVYSDSLDNCLDVSLSSVSDNSHISCDLNLECVDDTLTPEANLKRNSSPQSMSPAFPQSPTGLLHLGKHDDSYISTQTDIDVESAHGKHPPCPDADSYISTQTQTQTDIHVVVESHHEKHKSCSESVQHHKIDMTSSGSGRNSLESLEAIDTYSDKENNSSLLTENNSMTNQSNTSLGILSMCKSFAGKVVDFVKTSPSYLVDMISDSNKAMLLDNNSCVFASPQLKPNLVHKSSEKVDSSKSEIDRLLTSMEHLHNISGILGSDVATYAVGQSFDNDSPVSVERAASDGKITNDTSNTVEQSNKMQCMLSKDSDKQDRNTAKCTSNSVKDGPHTSSCSSASVKKKRKERRSTSRAFFDTFNAISVELNKDRTEELQTANIAQFAMPSGNNRNPLKTPVQASYSSCYTKINTNNVITPGSSVEHLNELDHIANVELFTKPASADGVDIETEIAISKPDTVITMENANDERPHSSHSSICKEDEFASVCLVTQRRKRVSPVISPTKEENKHETGDTGHTTMQAIGEPVNNTQCDGKNSSDKPDTHDKTSKQILNVSASGAKKAKLSKECSRNMPHFTIREDQNVGIETLSKDCNRNKKPTKERKSRRRSATFTSCAVSETVNTDTVDGIKIGIEDAFTYNNKHGREHFTECDNNIASNAFSLNINQKSPTSDTQNMEDKMSQLDICNTHHCSPESLNENQENGDYTVKDKSVSSDITAQDNVLIGSCNRLEFTELKCVSEVTTSRVKTESPGQCDNSVEEDCMVVDVIQDISEFQIKDPDSATSPVQKTVMDVSDGGEVVTDNCGQPTSDKMLPTEAESTSGVSGKEVGSDSQVEDVNSLLTLSRETRPTFTPEQLLTISDISLPDDKPAPRRRRRQSADAATLKIQMLAEGIDIESPAEDSPNAGPRTVIKPKRKRKNEPEVPLEQIYLNKNYQKPEAKKWESVLESPKDNGLYYGKRKMQTYLEFENPTQVKLKKRLQRAVRNGWDPKRRRRSILADSYVKSKLEDVWSNLDESGSESLEIKDPDSATSPVQKTVMDVSDGGEVVTDNCGQPTSDKMLPAEAESTSGVSGKEVGSDSQVDVNSLLTLSRETRPTFTPEQVLTISDISLPDDKPAPRRRRRQSADAATLKIQMLAESTDIESPAEDSPNAGPRTAIKPKRKRKNEPEVPLEQIYLNKNYQKPEAKKWESVLESPKDNGLYYGKRKMQTYLEFENPTQVKLKKRLQRAVRNGWDPKRRRRSILADSYVKSKLEDVGYNLDESGSESLEVALKAIIDTK